jgi:hypothetical protein
MASSRPEPAAMLEAKVGTDATEVMGAAYSIQFASMTVVRFFAHEEYEGQRIVSLDEGRKT